MIKPAQLAVRPRRDTNKTRSVMNHALALRSCCDGCTAGTSDATSGSDGYGSQSLPEVR